MTTSGAAAVKAAPWKDPAAKPYVQVDRITKAFGDFKAVETPVHGSQRGSFLV